MAIRYSKWHRENEKLTQREVLWQQVECLAKTKTEWVKATGTIPIDH